MRRLIAAVFVCNPMHYKRMIADDKLAALGVTIVASERLSHDEAVLCLPTGERRRYRLKDGLPKQSMN